MMNWIQAERASDTLPVQMSAINHDKYNVTQIAQETGVPLAVLQTVLASMGAEKAQESGPDKVEDLLRLKADEYNQLKVRLARIRGMQELQKVVLAAMGKAAQKMGLNKVEALLPREAGGYNPLKARQARFEGSDADIQKLRRKVVEAMEKAQFDEACAILAEIRRSDRAAIAADQGDPEPRLYSDAETSITLAAIKNLNITPDSYCNAARHYAEAAQIIGEIDPVKARQYRIQQANTLFCRDKMFESEEALLEAADIYRGVLREISKENEAEEWALTQNCLGIVLHDLGARENNRSTLREAVVASRAALEIYTSDTNPTDWAMAQDNLGSSLAILGEGDGNPNTLQDSATAFRAVLEVRTRDKAPLKWAATQASLGNVLRILGEREGDPRALQASVAAYRAALEVRTRDRTPLEWAVTQNNLGGALAVLGERDPSALQESVDAFHSAVEVFEKFGLAEAEKAKYNRGLAQATLDKLTPP